MWGLNVSVESQACDTFLTEKVRHRNMNDLADLPNDRLRYLEGQH